MRTSYWFVPSVMSVGAGLLAVAATAVDDVWREPIGKSLDWVVRGDADAARALLATIAGSMITIAGIAYSILIVALSLASQQLGPRVLIAFRADRGIQVALGSFLSTFVYCLLVLRRVGQAEAEHPIPHLSILIALAIGLMSLAVLIYFIHHAAESIQADHVIAAIGRDLEWTIQRLFPSPEEPAPECRQRAPLPRDLEARGRPIAASRSGYVQAVDQTELIKIAVKHDLMIKLVAAAGSYVLKGATVVEVYPADQLSADFESRLSATVVIGNRRTHAQDVAFAIEQLVEIAVRALSPGINDPFTAVRVVDRLSEGLARVFACAILPDERCDEGGRPRLIGRTVDRPGLIAVALGPIRAHAPGELMVLIQLLRAIGRVAPGARHADERRALAEQAMLILEDARRTVPNACDLRAVESEYNLAVKALEMSRS